MKERVEKIDDPWANLTEKKADLKKGLELLKDNS